MSKIARQGFKNFTPLQVLVVVLLILGIFFRFANLEQKFYWGDEAQTSLRTSGHTEEDVVQQLYDGQVRSLQDLQLYKFPSSEKNLFDTISVLADFPEHPPLYFLSVRFWNQFWMQGVEPSVALTRSLSVVIGLAIFPALYWLCLELFRLASVGWIAVAIAAISPLHVLYAQEAREYSLWTVAILLSSASLLRAIHLNTKAAWRLYAATLVMGFYSHLLFLLVAIAQGLYVLMARNFRRDPMTVSYLRAALIGVLAFLPWAIVAVTNLSHFSEIADSVQKETHPIYLLHTWFENLNLVFFSFDFNHSIDQWSPIDKVFRDITYDLTEIDIGFTELLLVAASIAAIAFLTRHAPRPARGFVVLLIGVTALPLMLPDLLIGGTQSTRIRYLIPAYLGIQIAFAYLFATQISAAQNWRQKGWQIGLIVLISGGIWGCAVDVPDKITWSKGSKAEEYVDAAHVINQTPQPLVISDAPSIRVLTLSYELNPEVKFQLLPSATLAKIPDGFSHVFVFNPSEKLETSMTNQPEYRVEPISTEKHVQLWQVLQPE